MSAVGSAGHDLAPGSRVGVFLVCTPQLLSSALAALLARDRQIAVVGAEAHGQAAAERLRQVEASVVVLCGVRSSRDAINKIAPIRAACPDARVLVLSSTHNEQTQLACIEAGAVGYINDDIGGEGFVQAVKRVHAGEVLFSQNVLMDLMHRSRRRSRGAPRSRETPVLAPREIEVLQAITLGLSTEEVAERLSITVSTVRTHMKNVLEKLGSHSKLDAVITAIRAGLIDLSDVDQ
jgi:DNA-binding NarL/FixJ family response regulator